MGTKGNEMNVASWTNARETLHSSCEESRPMADKEEWQSFRGVWREDSSKEASGMRRLGEGGRKLPIL